MDARTTSPRLPRWILVGGWIAVLIKSCYAVMLLVRPGFFYPGQELPPVADALAMRAFSPGLAIVIILAIGLFRKEASLLKAVLVALTVNESLDAFLAIHDWQRGRSPSLQGAFGPVVFAVFYLVALWRLREGAAARAP
jgi:hypothetical protein